MEALDWARWQFGITTVYHYIFVPLTIGLSLLVAIMQTVAWRKKSDEWLQLTKFFGKLLVVNFALGAATGIVQEFQFGMNWSEYARYVGDVFGGPLALEGLLAFFLESTFLGLWIFGWDKLGKRVHLLCIWMVALGTAASAYFILAANSFMQHPVGAQFNPETGRAELDPAQGGLWAVLTNITTLYAFPHVLTAAWLTGGAFVVGIATWHMVRHARSAKRLLDGGEVADLADETAVRVERHQHRSRSVYKPAVRLGLVAMLIAGIGLIWTGDLQSKIMFQQQPMKMASAEGLCNTDTNISFSLFAVGGVDAFNQTCSDVTHLVEVPGLLSFLATGDPSAELEGVNQLTERYTEQFGAEAEAADGSTQTANYQPNLFTTYWAFRLMIGFAGPSAILAVVGLWLTRRDRVPDQTWFSRLAVVAMPFPFLANAAGWIFTEIGRQPWVVHPLPIGDPVIRLLTMQGVSPNPAWQVATSLTVFTLLYAALAVAWFRLMHRYGVEGVADLDPPAPAPDESDRPLSFSY